MIFFFLFQLFIHEKLEELLLQGHLWKMIHQQSGEPPETLFNCNHSLYKLKKHRQHQDCKKIFNLLESNGDKNIVVLEPPLGDPSRHAEEQLTDQAIRLHKKSFGTGRRMTFQIRGKKRPCKACHGYMASREIVSYNKKSGFLFLDSLDRQIKNGQYEAVKISLELLLDELCFVSARWLEGKDKPISSYDTDSDSDHEKNEAREDAEQSFVEYYESRDRNIKSRNRNVKTGERIHRRQNMESRVRKAVRIMKTSGFLTESDY